MVENPPIEKRVGLTNKLFADDRLRVSPRLAKAWRSAARMSLGKGTLWWQADGLLFAHHRRHGLRVLVGIPAPKRVITSGGDTGFTWKNGTKNVYG